MTGGDSADTFRFDRDDWGTDVVHDFNIGENDIFQFTKRSGCCAGGYLGDVDVVV